MKRWNPSFGRFVFFALWGIAAWWLVRWWTSPIVAESLPIAGELVEQIIGYSCRGELIAAGQDPFRTTSDRVLVWKGESRTPTVVWRGERTASNNSFQFRLSPNGRWLSIDGIQRAVIDLESLETIPHTRSGKVWISPDRKYLFHDDRTAGLEVSEFKSGRVIGRIEDSWIDDISPNGEWILASTGEDFRLWRVKDDQVASAELTFTASQGSIGSYVTVIPQDLTENGAGKSAFSRFSPDSRRLVVYENNDLMVWQLDPLARVHWRSGATVGVSADCKSAVVGDKQVMSLEDGKIHPSAVSGDNGLTLCQLVDGKGLYLGIRQPTWPGAMASSGFSIPLGPYNLSLSPREPSSSATYCLVDVLNGREVTIPRAMARPYHAPQIPGFSGIAVLWSDAPSPRFFLYSDRLATVSPDAAEGSSEDAICWMIPLPPARPWPRQFMIWALLSAAPGLWLARGLRPKNPTARSAQDAGTRR